MIRPFMSSGGADDDGDRRLGGMDSPATRCKASATRLLARRFASVRASSSSWRASAAISCRTRSSDARAGRASPRRRSGPRSARAPQAASSFAALRSSWRLTHAGLAVHDRPARAASNSRELPPISVFLLRTRSSILTISARRSFHSVVDLDAELDRVLASLDLGLAPDRVRLAPGHRASRRARQPTLAPDEPDEYRHHGEQAPLPPGEGSTRRSAGPDRRSTVRIPTSRNRQSALRRPFVLPWGTAPRRTARPRYESRALHRVGKALCPAKRQMKPTYRIVVRLCSLQRPLSTSLVLVCANRAEKRAAWTQEVSGWCDQRRSASAARPSSARRAALDRIVAEAAAREGIGEPAEGSPAPPSASAARRGPLVERRRQPGSRPSVPSARGRSPEDPFPAASARVDLAADRSRIRSTTAGRRRRPLAAQLASQHTQPSRDELSPPRRYPPAAGDRRHDRHGSPSRRSERALASPGTRRLTVLAAISTQDERRRPTGIDLAPICATSSGGVARSASAHPRRPAGGDDLPRRPLRLGSERGSAAATSGCSRGTRSRSGAPGRAVRRRS